jgi:hypothetical protein
VQERAGNILDVIGIGKYLLNRIPAAPRLRERMDKWDFIKLKGFCTTKEMVCKLKRQPTEWEKIFASYTSDKGLITRIYKELKKLSSPKINELIIGKQIKQNFLKRRNSNIQKTHEKMLSISSHTGNANQKTH